MTLFGLPTAFLHTSAGIFRRLRVGRNRRRPWCNVLARLYRAVRFKSLARRVGIVPADKGVGGQYQENYAHVEGS